MLEIQAEMHGEEREERKDNIYLILFISDKEENNPFVFNRK